VTQGTVFDIQKYSIHDGPGIRTTVFLKGCPLTCLWCANPESQRTSSQVGFSQRLCTACGVCIATCPREAVREDEQFGRAIDYERCDLCLKCVEACPNGALAAIGRLMDTATVVEEVCRDSVFYRQSGGGVTIGGGEPYHQPAFLLDLVQSMKDEGLHVAVDTTGCALWRDIEASLPFVDLFLYDLKAIDNEAHQRLTGVGNRLILDNLRNLIERGKSVCIRVPVVAGYTDGSDDILALGRYLTELGHVVSVTLLPYHKLGIGKYRRLGTEYPLEGMEPPSEDQLANVRDTLLRTAKGIDIEIGQG
jgi:pyruvate formate lyase activating enzyme